ncbi:helix-turn-helix protein [Streptomyces sp. TLI_55]|nr:helix-turn-helix protein [Streptomyces sp. TLI_55]
MTRADLIGPGMSPAYLSRLESGARPPTERAVRLLAERLQVPASAFDVSDPSDLVDVLAAAMAAESASMSGELEHRLEEALESEKEADRALRWQAYSQLARIRGDGGDRPAEQQALTELVRLGDELGYAQLRIHSRLRLARCQRALGAIEEARVTARAGLDIGEGLSLTDPDTLRCRLLLISVTAEIGDLAEAGRLSTQACAALGEDARGATAAETLWTAATLSTRLGNHDQSAKLLHRAIGALDSRENLTLWMRLRLAGADLVMQAEPVDVAQARTYLEEVEPAVGLVGNRLHEQEHAFLEARLAHLEGDLPTAARLCAKASQGLEHMSFRDRVRLELLTEQIRLAQGGTRDDGKLRQLALDAQHRGMLDLTTQIWRAIAEIRD